MGLTYADRIQEIFLTTGTGAISLGGAVSGYLPFSSALQSGGTCYYAATDGTNWEVGIGTYAIPGNTLTRTTILDSNNNGSAVNWAAGTKSIWMDIPAAYYYGTPVLSSFSGLYGSWGSDTVAGWIATQLVLQNSLGQSYTANNFLVNLNTANTPGTPNGLDTGSLATNTWYYVYVIYNGASISCIMSLNSTAPALPAGYTYTSGAIGAVRLDSSKNIIGFIQSGRDVEYVVGQNLSVYPQMASGAAGTPQSALAAIAVAAYVPATAGKIKVNIGGGSGNNTVQLAANNNSAATNNSIAFLQNLSTAPVVTQEFLLQPGGNIYWAGTSNFIACVGFTLNI